MPTLKSIIEKNDTLWGRRFDLFIQALIVLALVCFSVETLPDISDKTINLLNIIEWITVIIFTIEYILRIWVADRKLRFIFSFYGLIDLAAILPFYLATGIDLRLIRALRLLRLFRAFKLIRFSKAINRFHKAMLMVREELIMFMALTIIVLFLAGSGIYFFEHRAQPEVFKSIFDSLWWAVTSLTTVGYGDMVPITIGGKVFTFIVLMIGLGIIAVPTGLIASALSKAREIEPE